MGGAGGQRVLESCRAGGSFAGSVPRIPPPTRRGDTAPKAGGAGCRRVGVPPTPPAPCPLAALPLTPFRWDFVGFNKSCTHGCPCRSCRRARRLLCQRCFAGCAATSPSLPSPPPPVPPTLWQKGGTQRLLGLYPAPHPSPRSPPPQPGGDGSYACGSCFYFGFSPASCLPGVTCSRSPLPPHHHPPFSVPPPTHRAGVCAPASTHTPWINFCHRGWGSSPRPSGTKIPSCACVCPPPTFLGTTGCLGRGGGSPARVVMWLAYLGAGG